MTLCEIEEKLDRQDAILFSLIRYGQELTI